MPIAAIFAEEAALALAAELAPYAAGEAALAVSALGAEALMGLGAEALGTSAIGGAESLAASEAMAANAASGGAGAGAANINAAQVAAQQSAAQGINAIPQAMSPAQQAYQAASSASATPGITPGVQPLPAYPNAFPNAFPEPVFQNIGGQGFAQPQTFPVSEGIASPALAAPPPPPPPVSPINTMGLEMPGAYVPEPMYSGMGMEGQIPANQFIEPGSAGMPSMENTIAQANVPVTPPSGLEAGFDKALKFAEKNPFTAMTGAYMGASALGLLNPSGNTFNDKPYDGPLSKYKLSPNFQAGNANPANFQYNPATNRRYAGGGGIMGVDPYVIPVGYANGGKADDPATVPMGSNRFSPVDQYKNIVQDTKLATGEIGVNDYRAALLHPNTSDIEGQKIAQGFLQEDSDAGRFAVPGYGDQGQFFGSSNPLKDDNPYNVDAFARGGSLSDSIASYQKMLGGQPQAAPTKSPDVGIYYDQDPDTRYQDALTAAQIRQAKVNQRAYVSPPVAKRPTPMGQLQMASVKPRKQSDSSGDVEARHGGIMHASLGDYAAGGNPRLLKGPGDGMSDNIPATINGHQPARLADGEFVIPADVVSHLGNGSTEAGAKQLHAMMNKIRKARTGNPKQGKQINAGKYMPK